MMINLNRQTVFVLGTTFAIGIALGWFMERDRVNRKVSAVLAEHLIKKDKEEEKT